MKLTKGKNTMMAWFSAHVAPGKTLYSVQGRKQWNAKLWEITDDGSRSDLRGALAKKTKENLKGEKQTFRSYVDVFVSFKITSFVCKLRADVNQLLRAVMSNMQILWRTLFVYRLVNMTWVWKISISHPLLSFRGFHFIELGMRASFIAKRVCC